jgi:putative aldouronate transport system substrate-binding protein
MDWAYGDQTLSYIWEGYDPDVWGKLEEFNRDADRSIALGFCFDAAPVQRQWDNCRIIQNEFASGLESGYLDPEEALPEFTAKLDAAGIAEVIAEKQRQLDAWLAEADR